jgi:threonine 3-dehydrogenase
MAKLVTGGTGNVGAEIARRLVNRGEEVVVFDVALNSNRIEDLVDKVKLVRGDLGDFNEVLNLFKYFKVDSIYHAGSILGAASEINPWASFQTNVLGTYHVFEAARLFDVQKMMFTSSRATFGLGMDPAKVIDDWSLQRPVDFYGCGKLYCEGLGRWYAKKYGLHFRSIRLANVIVPGDRARSHWAPHMIEDAILGRPHVCQYATPEVADSWVYFKDVAKAAIDVLDAPQDKICSMNYNVTGIPIPVSVKETEAYLKQRYPGFQVTYMSDNRRAKLKEKAYGDNYARQEWGWNPDFKTVEEIIVQFEKDFKEHPKRYGLNP